MNRGRAATMSNSGSLAAAKPGTNDPEVQTTRETVESIVVAVVLAFLFRAFVAEAFVIPTGSMAPTLQGRHLDVYCDQCGNRFQTGASSENFSPKHGDFQLVEEVTCPVCRYSMVLDRTIPKTTRSGRRKWLDLRQHNSDAFNGDRILVSKFAYQLADPKRWDVIVFKYPGNAKQNYIKRLIGLPNETLRIQHGDVFVRKNENEKFRIARKPASKVKAMLQLVNDSANISHRLRTVGWPARWSQHSKLEDAHQWMNTTDGTQFRVTAGSEESWLRYQHCVPWPDDWDEINKTWDESTQTGELPDRHIGGQLITDYYPYNDSNTQYGRYPGSLAPSQMGSAWVGDLAVECDVSVQSDDGHLLLKLVEGGWVFDCRIDVSTGEATLVIDNGNRSFVADDGKTAKVATAQTKVRGAGSYKLRFANVDDQLLLWVNERSIKFDGSTTFEPGASERPKWTTEDPYDLAPIGIGGQNITMQVKRLRVLRDIYYLALELANPRIEYETYYSPDQLKALITTPHAWKDADEFSERRAVEFVLGPDQFFPMGDNSPQSKDARLWSTTGNSASGYDNPPPYVERQYLIGKALLIYWPHAWRPFWPNFSRMGTIR